MIIKSFEKKLNVIEAKFNNVKKENEFLHNKVMIAEKTLMTFSINHQKLNDRIIEMEGNMHRLEWYSCCRCIKIADILNSITNDLLKEHIILIFKKLWVVI